MDGSTLVFIVVPIVIPLVLAIGIALPFIAARQAPQHPASEVSSAHAPARSAGIRARTYADRDARPVRNN